jgi:hypothetical protein
VEAAERVSNEASEMKDSSEWIEDKGESITGFGAAERVLRQTSETIDSSDKGESGFRSAVLPSVCDGPTTEENLERLKRPTTEENLESEEAAFLAALDEAFERKERLNRSEHRRATRVSTSNQVSTPTAFVLSAAGEIIDVQIIDVRNLRNEGRGKVNKRIRGTRNG